MKNTKDIPSLLIIEDDPDQMQMLVSLVLTEIKSLMIDGSVDDVQRDTLKQLKIIKVSNLNSLKQAVSQYKNTIFVLMDCNIPDTKGSAANDQLVKTNHRITGQHNSVDIIINNLPKAEITMISSLNRFQKIVSRYYKNTFDLSLNFIRKNDQESISNNIQYQLVSYLKLKK